METDQSKTAELAAVRSTDGFCVGDKVTWAKCVSNGYSMRWSTREGKIARLCGPMAYVKMRNGREVNILTSLLRKAGEKTFVTELFEDMAAAQTQNDPS